MNCAWMLRPVAVHLMPGGEWGTGVWGSRVWGGYGHGRGGGYPGMVWGGHTLRFMEGGTRILGSVLRPVVSVLRPVVSVLRPVGSD